MFALFLITIFFSVLTSLLAPTQKAQRGNLKDFSFPQVQDGDPIAYAVGRVKIAGTGLTWYGDFQTKAIKKSTGLFTTSTVGYKYYLGWQLVIAIGPNVMLRNLWFGTPQGQTNTANGFEDDTYIEENNPNFTNANDTKIPVPVWGVGIASYPGGPIITEPTGTAILDVSNVKAFGGDNGGGGFDLSVEFYGGENSQTSSVYLQSQVNQAFVPPYRGVSHLICHGYIGNSASLQNMTVEIDRIYDPLELGSQAIIGQEGDANPANVIYELLTNNFGAASIPLPRMNSASFVTAGGILWTEDEGISIAFGSSPTAVSNVLKDILRQIDATLYEDPTDGQIYLKLIRADYVLADLPVIDQTNILSVQSFTTNMWSDTKNRIRVSYEDRSKYYDDRVAVGEDMANVAFQGGQVKAITVQHPYIKRAEHANRKVAQEMAIYTTPLSKLTVTTQRFTTSLRPGSVINMVYPAYKIASIAYRVTKVSMGDLTNNRLSLELVQDKFATVQFVFAAPVNFWQKPNTSAVNIVTYNAEEAPRFFNALQPTIVNVDNSRLFVQPIQPNIAQSGYNIWAKITTETDYAQIDYEQSYATLGTLQNNLAMELLSTVTLASISDIDSLAVANQAQISSGLNLIQIDDEIMAYESYVLAAGLYTLENVHRGLLDTVPATHAASANVVFLTPDTVGTREFAGTEAVDVLMGSYSFSDEQTQDEATHVGVQLMQRPQRPYPPADVMIDGVLYNPNVDNTSGCTVTFKRRSRLNLGVLYQTDADEAPEAGTTYIARVGIPGHTVDHALGTADTGTFTFDLAGSNVVQIIAVLDGLESQPVQWDTTVAHAAGVSVGVALAAAATTVAITPEELLSHDAGLATATTSPIVAIATIAGAVATGDLGTPATTVAITPTTTGGGGVIETTPHRYWGIRLNTPQTSGTNFAFGELEMYEHDLSSGNAALGITAFADGSSFTGADQGLTHVFDGKVGANVGNVGIGSSAAGYKVWGDFVTPIAIDCIRLACVESQYAISMPSDFDVISSDDAMTWNTEWSATPATWGEPAFEYRAFMRPGKSLAYSGSPWGAHAYWRMVMVDSQDTSGWGAAEISMRATAGGSNQCTGGTATTNNAYATPTYDAPMAFDGNPATLWGSNGHGEVGDEGFGGGGGQVWIQYEFAAPVSVGEIAITARNDSFFGQSPYTFLVEYSDDGTLFKEAWTAYAGSLTPYSSGSTVVFTDPNLISDSLTALSDGEGGLLDDGTGQSLESLLDESTVLVPLGPRVLTSAIVPEVTISGEPTFEGVLDGRTDVAAAYGFRRMATSYTGPLIKIRNQDTLSSMDIGYIDNGELDQATMLAFLGSANGTISTWYDQSGNGRDIGGGLPSLVSSGTVDSVNGYPAAAFNATPQSNSGWQLTDSAFSAIIAGQRTSGGYNAFVSQSISSHSLSLGIDPSGKLDMMRNGVSDVNGQSTSDDFCIVSWVGSAGMSAFVPFNVTGYLNSDGGTSFTLTYGESLLNGVSIGGAYAGGDTVTGIIAEVVLLNDAIADVYRENIESNMKTRFGVS
jgi:hypothetical protein